MRHIVLYNVHSTGAWALSPAEAAYDLARGRQLGDILNEWLTADRAGNPMRVIRQEGTAHDGTPLGGVYVIPV